MTSFSDLGVRKDIADSLAALGYDTPTPVQLQTIPAAFEGLRDMVVLAQTGTGKTAAFGIPLVQLTSLASREVQALVLCPTRELCVQVAGDLTGFAKGTPSLRIAALYGGAPILGQIHALRAGAHILVATPGRLNDLIRRKKVDLSGLRFLVLDEADEMLQMGFQDELNAILEETPAEKTTLLFSATMPPELTRIAAGYLKKPMEITVGKRNAGAENIRHIALRVEEKTRYEVLRRLVDYHPDMYGIIFCRTRQETKDVAEGLSRDGYSVDALHGDLSQSQRDWVMQRFRNRSLSLLVATDVAARGLDVADLTHVIHYTLPADEDVYTHRSGRTGRAGKDGISMALATPKDTYKVRKIEHKLGKVFETGKIPTGTEILRQQALRRMGTLRHIPVDPAALDPFMPDILELLHALDREELIRRFIAADLHRFLELYQNARDLNIPSKPFAPKKTAPGKREPFLEKGKPTFGKREPAFGKREPAFGKREPAFEKGEPTFGKRAPFLEKEEPTFGKRAPSPRERQGDSGLVQVHFNVGKKDGVNPARLIARINEISGRSDIRIGRIEILERSAMMEADGKYAREVLRAFSQLRINGKPVVAELAEPVREKKTYVRKTPIRRRSSDE